MTNAIIEDFNKSISSLNSKSDFMLRLGEKGGYVVFSNSGRGGNPKDFIIDLESLRTTFIEILKNIDDFSAASNYEERTWRDLCPRYLSTNSVVTISTVQTKPFFCTISKIINWATNSEISNDLKIDLSKQTVEKTIERLDTLIEQYNPKHLTKIESKNVLNYFDLNGSIANRVNQIVIWLIQTGLFQKLFGHARKNMDTNSFGGDLYTIQYEDQRLTSILINFSTAVDSNSLSQNGVLRFIADTLPHFADGFWYLSKEWTDNSNGRLDFRSFVTVFNKIYAGTAKLIIHNEVWRVEIDKKERTLPKPFLILAGISGTGKSRWVREQAKAWSAYPNNFALIPVRPDWHEPSDLLGYVSRISSTPEYVPTDFLRFLVKAWLATPCETLEPTEAELSEVMPYWLCLDEMNLAPVEQYFADYLAILETRDWKDQKYKCDPILKAGIIKDLKLGVDGFFESIGLIVKDEAGAILSDLKRTYLISLFKEQGIPLPPNLIVAGTVNMDETTHQFSRKVIDRALTLDFGEFFPNEYDEFLGTEKAELKKPRTLTYSTITQAIYHDAQGVPQPTPTATQIRSKEFLAAVNKSLKSTPFELAYRALNELLVSVACFAKSDDSNLPDIWDDFLMMKVLPRIEGDQERIGDILKSLKMVLPTYLKHDNSSKRNDLFREDYAGNEIVCDWRTIKMIETMEKRLTKGYTSFWP